MDKWVLQITNTKNDVQFVIKEKKDDKFKRVASIKGNNLLRCLSVICNILSYVCDEKTGEPLGLHSRAKKLKKDKLPLDETAFAKLALIFKLQERMRDLNKVELIALRVNRFSREEAIYWLARITHYGKAGNWAKKGLRIVLCGDQGDEEDAMEMLIKLRNDF